MKTHILLLVVGLALAFTLMRTVHTPESMITPGTTIQAHEEVANDCFACHTPFIGASADKCIDCHKVDEIGLLTTKGLSIAREKKNVRFHQQLVESDCVACHSDHKGVQPFRPISRFSHKLLQAKLQKQCGSCHNKPKDSLHSKLMAECSQCHTQNKWKPATFRHKSLDPVALKQCESCHDKPKDKKHRKFKSNCNVCHGYDDWEASHFKHSKLPPAELKQCQSCHENPGDSLHRTTKLECGECHDQDKWKPATFKHDKFFRFDRHHRTDCDTCHLNNDYAEYTCYGCHEHSRSKVRSEHREEGIRDYENCTECHRSANEHEAKRAWRAKRNGGETSGSFFREWEHREEHDDDDDD